MKETEVIDGVTVSKLQVLRSAAGYYIGRESLDEEFDVWVPYYRLSVEYYRTYDEAQEALDTKTFTERLIFG